MSLINVNEKKIESWKTYLISKNKKRIAIFYNH